MSDDTEVCTPWFYPVRDDKVGKMCNPWNTQKFQGILRNQIPKDECKYCLPDCTTTIYETAISYAELQKCDHTNIGTNMLCDMVNGDMNPAPWRNQAKHEFANANLSVPWYVDTGPERMNNNRKKIMGLNMEDSLIFKSEHDKEPTYDAFEQDIAIVNIFFGNPHIIRYAKYSRMSLADFLSQTGGSIGLALGISMLSIVEMIYWFTVRLSRNYGALI